MRRILTSLAPLAVGCAPTVDLEDRWTVGLYMAADNNLDPFATRDLDEITRAGVPDSIDLYVLLDRSPTGAFAVEAPRGLDLFEDARLIQIVGNDYAELEAWGEVDTSSAATLERFTTFLADRNTTNNALILWNHGGGTIYGSDRTDGRRAMAVSGLADAIRNGFGRRRTLDLLGFDACLMASEASLTTFSDVAEVLVASAELEPGPGWPYEDVMAAFRPNRDGEVPLESLAIDLVEAYGRAYADSGKSYQPRLGAWRLDDEISGLFHDLARAEADAEAQDRPTWWRTINRAVASALPYGAPQVGSVARYVDLGDLLDGLERSDISEAAQALRDGLLDRRLAIAPAFDDASTLGLNLTLDPELRPEVTTAARSLSDAVGRATDSGPDSVQAALAPADTTAPVATLTGVERLQQTLFEVLVAEVAFTEDVGIDESYLFLGRRGADGDPYVLDGVAQLRARGLTELAPTRVGLQLFSLGLTSDATQDGDTLATLIASEKGTFATVLVREPSGSVSPGAVVLDPVLSPLGIVLEADDGTTLDLSLDDLALQGAEIATFRIGWDTTTNELSPQLGAFFDAAELVPTIVPVTGDDVEASLYLTDVAGQLAAVAPVKPFDLPAP